MKMNDPGKIAPVGDSACRARARASTAGLSFDEWLTKTRGSVFQRKSCTARSEIPRKANPSTGAGPLSPGTLADRVAWWVPQPGQASTSIVVVQNSFPPGSPDLAWRSSAS